MAKTKATDRLERTAEITGLDATMDEAQAGDAGNGADPYGEDFTGGMPRPIEDEPDQPGDILPDQIGRFPRQGKPEEDLDITARPSDTNPIDPSEL